MMQQTIKKKTEYRNSIRSRKMIREAFIELAKDRDIVKIKVKDVIELADISKGTFYAHYTSVHDVLREIESRYLSAMFSIFEEISPKDMLRDFSLLFSKILEIMESERMFMLGLFHSNFGDGFFERIRNTFVEHMVSDETVISEFVSPRAANAYFTYSAGGSFTIIKNWLTNPLDIESQTIVLFINDFLIQGMKSIRR